MKRGTGIALLILMMSLAFGLQAMAQEVLPQPPQPFKGKIGLKAKDSTPDWPEPVRAPEGAPNVVLILLDDVGFGASSSFGGPVPTPAFDKLAEHGLRYNQFHTTAVCSPTRAALITGRNHHTVHTGTIMETATGYPGYDSLMGKDTATIAEILKQHGYGTSWFGKNHNVPDWQSSQAGPFDLWPMSLGFEYFYGFIAADTNQWTPALFEGIKPIEPYIGKPGYILNTDMADKAIEWMRRQKALAPDKPFFLYYAPGATHAPHHAPKEWVAKFKGQFDHGWDKQREITFEKQKAMGIIPTNSVLTPRPSVIPAWDAATPEQKKLFARMMEVYAAFLAHTDYEIGRVLDELDILGVKDNTLVILIIGDNGASGEGSPQGLANENTFLNGVPENIDDLLKHIDDFGSPWGYNHYPVGWAWAMDTPFQWCKQIASHYGGTRNGLIISWPKRIKDQGAIRYQWHHVIDIEPTILESLELEAPSMVNGVAQKPIEGVSMVYTFDDAKARSRRPTQYFEMLGNRGIYDDGWIACTTPTALPWVLPKAPVDVINGYKWELYHVDEDFTEANNLVFKYPEKLKELQLLFYAEAAKYNVLPLDNSSERFDVSIRPSLTRGRTSVTYYPGMTRITEGTAPDLKNKSFSITANVEIPKDGAEGVIVTQGGRYGGWGLFLRDGKVVYHYNWSGVYRGEVESRDKLAPGKHTIIFDFKYDGGPPGSGGTGILTVDDKKTGEGRIEHTLGGRISIDETFDVGEDTGTPVCDDYQVPYKFTGKLEKVTIELKPMKKADQEAAEKAAKEAQLKKILQD